MLGRRGMGMGRLWIRAEYDERIGWFGKACGVLGWIGWIGVWVWHDMIP